jgi:hypothetical protein
MASVRFVRNINLKVSFEDTVTMVPFGSGDIYEVTKIELDDEGYGNIHMPDGSIIQGVASEVFENMGKKVPVVHISTVEVVPENTIIELEEEDVEVALFDGTMLSESE